MAELTQPATVLTIADLTPNVRQLVVIPKIQRVVFQPGQWVSLQLPVGAKPPLNRAYSMAEPPSPDGQLTLVLIASKTESVLIISMDSSPAMSCCSLAPTEISDCPSHSIRICSLLVAIPAWSRFVVC